MKRVVGIDLGTTNSCVAYIEGGRARVIPNAAGYRTTPSCVAFDKDRILVGQPARRQLLTNPRNTLMSVKRLVGRSFESQETYMASRMYAYQMLKGDKGDVVFDIQGRRVSVQQVSALILSEMRKIAEAHLEEPVEDVVITVPAYFDDAQRQATREAGEIAGLNVLRMINEPTAAALAYGFQRKTDKRIVVYDLGGGTFDISILDVRDSVFRVLATAGNTFLGGDDIDRKILARCLEVAKQDMGVDIQEDAAALARLTFACEQAKQDLSQMQSVDIQLPFLKVGHRAPLNFVHTLTRRDLQNLSTDLVDETLLCVTQCLKEAGIGRDDIDDVLLVGGQTRMPFVTDRVSNFFGRTASRQINPDEAVALGAAIHADALMQGREDGALLLDVIPQSLGINTAGGLFAPVILANTTLPVTAQRVFNTVRDDQSQVRIEIYQGEHSQSEKNHFLGDFILGELGDTNGQPKDIEVAFAVDASGMLQVSAKDLLSGKAQAIELRSKRLSPQEIQSLREQQGAIDLDLPGKVGK